LLSPSLAEGGGKDNKRSVELIVSAIFYVNREVFCVRNGKDWVGKREKKRRKLCKKRGFVQNHEANRKLSAGDW